jgi:alpha-amylase
VTYNLTSRSGDEDGLRDAIKRCHAAGVDIYVDAVINHMAAGSGVGVGGTPFSSRSFPAFSPDDFHHSQGDDHSNCQVT